jgi:hypothetical protein
MSFILIKSGSINLLLAIFLLPSCFAQVIQKERYELVLEDRPGLDVPHVISMGDKGIFTYQRRREKANDLLEFIKIDTALRENWRGVVSVDKNLMVSNVVTQGNLVYFLFRSVTYGGFNFNIVSVDINTRSYNSYIVKNLIPLKPSEFIISGNTMLIGGYFNEIPVVLHYNLKTLQSRLLPGFFNEEGTLTQIKTYEDGLIDIIVSMKNLQRRKVLWIRSYSPDGDLINSTILEDPAMHLLFGRSLRKPDGTLVVTGNFSVRNSDYSKGVFFTDINVNGDYHIQFHNFSDFDNFFKYMKPSREARVMARIERRKIKEKKIRHNYLFLNHELQLIKNNYVLLGEAFYPRYYYLNALGYSTRGERIFDGYRYTHASVIGLNQQGKVLWDNALEINDIKIFNLQQFVKLAPIDEKLGLIYLYENELRSKTIEGKNVVEAKTLLPLKLKNESDRINEKSVEYSQLEYWYAPYFFAYGVQYINNSRNMRDNSVRRVLFINKLKFQ